VLQSRGYRSAIEHQIQNGRVAAALTTAAAALYVGQAALYNQVAPIESSTLGSNCRFVVDGSANDSRVQPLTGLFAERNGQPLRAALDANAPAVLLTTSGTTGQPEIRHSYFGDIGKYCRTF